jgi:hypothetical protein
MVNLLLPQAWISLYGDTQVVAIKATFDPISMPTEESQRCVWRPAGK